VYLLHCTRRCNILCSKHDIDMRMNEWNRHALFLSWNRRNRYLHSFLLKIWDFFHLWEKFSVFPLVPLRSTREKTEFLTKKSQIFNRDSCKNLLVSKVRKGSPELLSMVIYPAIITFAVQLRFANMLFCFIHLVYKNWYLNHVERTIRNDNSIARVRDIRTPLKTIGMMH
jgi:hypothetical protein